MEKQNPIIVGKLFAKWCVHCKNLESIWKNMKEELKDKIESKELKIVEFEETDDKEKLEDFKKEYPVDIQGGYPTIFKINKEGNITYYSGDRDLESLKKWVNEDNDEHKKNGGSIFGKKNLKKTFSKKNIKKTIFKKRNLKKSFSKKNLRKTFKKILQLK